MCISYPHPQIRDYFFGHQHWSRQSFSFCKGKINFQLINSIYHKAILFLDFIKAFYSLNVDLLIKKFEVYDTRRTFLENLNLFLHQREQRTLFLCIDSNYVDRQGCATGIYTWTSSCYRTQEYQKFYVDWIIMSLNFL